jgi:WD40 repeat protein
MTFSPDSKWLAVSAGAGAIFIWDVATENPVRSIHGLLGWAPRIWFNARGDSIVFTSVFGKELYATA